MRAYAEGTSVPVEKSKAEIERLLQQYGAQSVLSGQMPGKAVVAFDLADRRVRFDLPLPQLDAYELRVVRGRKVKATPEQQRAAWEADCRQRWRGLLLVIKAKLESARGGIETFEEAFLAQIVVNGQTVGQRVIPELAAAYAGKPLPPLLGAGSQP